jgi:hypothetical protein
VSIKGALKRLEGAAGVGLRCLNCRVHYIRLGEAIRCADPADLYVTTCGRCGHTLKFLHSGYTPRERVVLVYVSTSPESEQNAAKWIASYAWAHHLPRHLEIEKIGEAEEKRLRSLPKDKEARRRVQILEEAEARREQTHTPEAVDAALPGEWAAVIGALDEVRGARVGER